jgi:AmmeMemoRadiSam system protein B/AmmeMemoRadiSam system protein A
MWTSNKLSYFITKILLLGVLTMVQSCEGKEYRESIHAGSWYPGTEEELTDNITMYLKKARSRIQGEVYGLISPHAGYVYSAPVAAFAYKAIKGNKYDDVIVIGPSHRHGFFGASVDTLAGRRTPLGIVEFDGAMAKALIKSSSRITHEPAAHRQEHSIEIQIPFLQSVLREFKLVEIIMGTQDYETCEILSKAIIQASKGKRILVVASSDLSHYHSQNEAETLDNLVIEAVAKYDPRMLYNRLSTDSCEACGGGPIVTALLVAQEFGATLAEPVMYATSGTVSGDYSQVVGYLAAVMYNKVPTRVGVDLGFSDEDKAELKEIARTSVQAAVTGKKPPEPKKVSDNLKEPYGIFVTLNKHGDLRGCIGLFVSDQPLYKSCQEMARAAALDDPRFPAVTKKELEDIEIEISILTPPEEVKDIHDIVIGRDGLIISRGYQRGLLLPQVAAEYGWTVEEFLAHTCMKAGLPDTAYKDKDVKIHKFTAEVF